MQKCSKQAVSLRQSAYCCVTGVVRALANNSIHDALLICSRNSQLMKCIHASPSVYGMHRAGRQEYEAISLSTYSDNMNLRYGVPVIQQSSMKQRYDNGVTKVSYASTPMFIVMCSKNRSPTSPLLALPHLRAQPLPVYLILLLLKPIYHIDIVLHEQLLVSQKTTNNIKFVTFMIEKLTRQRCPTSGLEVAS